MADVGELDYLALRRPLIAAASAGAFLNGHALASVKEIVHLYGA
jgi:hypothetical protein